jgi:hypothetical protein
MSKLEAHEITIEVNANLAVSDKTASMCLLLLEMYMNAHPEMDLIGHFDEQGCVSYELKKRGGSDECDLLTPTR